MLLGINYNSNTGNLTSDLAFLKSYGFTRIRAFIADYNDSASITLWRGYVQTMLSQGFYVLYGLSSNPTILTSSNWSTFAAAVQAEATWAQSVGNANLEFQIGNEEELHKDGSLTQAQVRSNLRTNATAVKAIYTVGKISYSSSSSTQIVDDWSPNSEGIGSLDRIGFNIYLGGTTFDSVNAKNIVSHIVSGFSDLSKVFASEFAPSTSGFTTISGMTEDIWTSRMSEIKNLLSTNNIPEAYYYNYGLSDNFGIKMASGDLRYGFARLIGQRRWYL